MGVAYYIVLETKIDDLDTSMDGKHLATHIESLDSVARELGLRPLSEFYSVDPQEAADAIDMDINDVKLPPLEQYSAEDGLVTVRALLPRPEAQPVLHDLQDCERILTSAAQHGVGWHFQIDI